MKIVPCFSHFIFECCENNGNVRYNVHAGLRQWKHVWQYDNYNQRSRRCIAMKIVPFFPCILYNVFKCCENGIIMQ
jgi:hypothetical protein